MDLKDYVEHVVSDTHDWFGDEMASDLTYNAIAMAGEAGEFLNLVKKIMRGDLEIDQHTLNQLADESIDVFIYLCALWGLLKVDPDASYEEKREYNAQRFGTT